MSKQNYFINDFLSYSVCKVELKFSLTFWVAKNVVQRIKIKMIFNTSLGKVPKFFRHYSELSLNQTWSYIVIFFNSQFVFSGNFLIDEFKKSQQSPP